MRVSTALWLAERLPSAWTLASTKLRSGSTGWTPRMWLAVSLVLTARRAWRTLPSTAAARAPLARAAAWRRSQHASRNCWAAPCWSWSESRGDTLRISSRSLRRADR
ncbi:hypothetical protein BE11_03970 [Sorangium cellulosum]|nr:hypothetical protein BE11_03970 [Sorangium cellulosum]